MFSYQQPESDYFPAAEQNGKSYFRATVNSNNNNNNNDNNDVGVINRSYMSPREIQFPLHSQQQQLALLSAILLFSATRKRSLLSSYVRSFVYLLLQRAATHLI
ncbi:unnamed protein product [Trichogramma brassicae]|uniref:Uncharacterized protein n=1 Tax=Trichogramma brassicae TaxID=86971 RepID=A0A6H5IAX3_9HYME|nr:unnamed protein product [Trichogramma brassicae]